MKNFYFKIIVILLVFIFAYNPVYADNYSKAERLIRKSQTALIKEESYEYIEEARQLYKEKYDDYLKDLAVIGQTGKIPFNKTLEEDLKKMNSNSAFVVK